jgi:hypothetical protein
VVCATTLGLRGAKILATSVERRGAEGKRRPAAVLAAGMRKIAAEPEGPATRERARRSKAPRSIRWPGQSKIFAQRLSFVFRVEKAAALELRHAPIFHSSDAKLPRPRFTASSRCAIARFCGAE